VQEFKHWIGGKPVDPHSAEWIDKVAPATAQRIGRLARGDATDVARAVDAARAALAGPWKDCGDEERASLCDRIASGIEARSDELARLESEDTGKPLSLARAVDIPRAVSNFRFFASALRQREESFHHMGTAFSYTLRRPLGVVALITPWNLPLYLLSWKAAPALAMGNAIVAKPSELTPRSASVLASIFNEAGAPAGVFNLVHGYGPEAGQALVEHPDVAGVSFTGGTKTGAQVAATAASSFKKLSLELGGKNPSVVFADCDFDTTVDGVARAAFLNQGQICLCGSRILVERPLVERFTAALVERAKAMRIGDPSDADTNLGALISQEHRQRVESYIALARDEGGKILCGGGRPELAAPFCDGAFVEPTVVGGLPIDCRTATEEIFGPMATIHAFEGEKEAVEMANSVRYGLSASVWTQDLERAHRVAAVLEAGLVWVNCWLVRDLRVPFGGVKESGVGREGGRWSLEFFSEAKSVCVKAG
jgi:aminomuconate-semialdehyde/2-hydroxymuconate-6-semialdehyde dehydrogenase